MVKSQNNFVNQILMQFSAEKLSGEKNSRKIFRMTKKNSYDEKLFTFFAEVQVKAYTRKTFRLYSDIRKVFRITKKFPVAAKYTKSFSPISEELPER